MSWRRVRSRQVSFLTRRLKSGRDMFLLILAMTLTLFMSSFFFETSGPASPSSSSPSIWGIGGGGGSSSMAQISSSNDASALLYGTSFRTKNDEQQTFFRSSNLPTISSSSKSRTLLNQVNDILKEIENVKRRIEEKYSKSAMFKGQRNAISRDLPLYKWVLSKHGYKLITPTWAGKNRMEQKRKISSLESTTSTETIPWNLLFCLSSSSSSDSTCIGGEETTVLKPNQKVNIIPGMRILFGRKDFSCQTLSDMRKIPSLMREPVSPLCFLLPAQYQQFLDVSDALGFGTDWILKPIQSIPGSDSSSQNHPERLDVFSKEGKDKLRIFATKHGIIQQLVSSPLLIYGQPVNLQFFLLVTSIEPLRVFVHSKGLVYHRSSSNQTRDFQKLPGRVWSFPQFWRHVEQNFGADRMKTAKGKVKEKLAQLLLVAETFLVTEHFASYSASSRLDSEHFASYSTSSRLDSETQDEERKKTQASDSTCSQCFQLMAIDVIFNSNLDPFIIDVNLQPNMKLEIVTSKDGGIEREGKNLESSIRKSILSDMLNLISSNDAVASDVTDALEEIVNENVIGIMGVSCQISHEICLGDRDLTFLIDSRREDLNLGGYEKLYPSPDMGIHKQLLDELGRHLSWNDNSLNKLPGRGLTVHRTADLHPLLKSLERFYFRHLIGSNEESDHDPKNVLNEFSGNNNWTLFTQGHQCSEEAQTLPFIKSIGIKPSITLTPSFISPHITTYFGNVSFDTILITVSGTSLNCQTEVRLDGKYGPSRPSSYTLGLGLNKITLVVVDITHTEPWILTTYTLNIYRNERSNDIEKKRKFRSEMNQIQVCSLKQDCDLRIYPREPCGLQPSSKYTSWKEYQEMKVGLPACTSGRAEGRWIIPCTSCDEENTCIWSRAVWDPFHCRHLKISRDRLKRCLANKQVLFIGDSTNRGMMHYLIEKLNGSLLDGSKIHELKLYPHLNEGKTTLFGFTYYPKFWLPTNQRLPFDQEVLQLLNHSMKEESSRRNDSEVVIVFGGVQWLALQHINLMFKALASLRMESSKVKLVMKTLGAGFHEPIEGVHHVSLEDQKKLPSLNQGLGDAAESLGIQVVDTFNITMSRFKEFYPGKCACHFHSIKEFEDSSRASEQQHSGRTARGYHVEGSINSIYSEILITRICS